MTALVKQHTHTHTDMPSLTHTCIRTCYHSLRTLVLDESHILYKRQLCRTGIYFQLQDQEKLYSRKKVFYKCATYTPVLWCAYRPWVVMGGHGMTSQPSPHYLCTCVPMAYREERWQLQRIGHRQDEVAESPPLQSQNQYCLSQLAVQQLWPCDMVTIIPQKNAEH